MCIIAIKAAEVAKPDKETLTTMFNRNKDGAGIAYAYNGKIKIVKGLMTLDDFLKAVDAIPDTATAILHCRISTAGGVHPELTHPFEITNSLKKLRVTKTILTEGYATAHNGIFAEFGSREGANDTMQFVATYLNTLKVLKDKTGGSIIDTDLDAIISKLCSGSRLAILTTDGRVKKYGSGWVEHNGIHYSNTSYKKYEVTTCYTYKDGKLTTTYEKRPYYYYDYDDEDEALYNYYYSKYYTQGKTYATANANKGTTPDNNKQLEIDTTPDKETKAGDAK